MITRLKFTALSLLSSLLLFACGAAPVFACRCAQPPAPKAALATAGDVFVGRVTRVDMIQDPQKKILDTATGEVQRITLRVDRSWKGARAKTVVVFTQPGKCSPDFQKDQDYLVYTTRQSAPVVLGCGRTTLLENAQEDLKELGPSL